MARKHFGKLIIIGGHEAKDGENVILRAVADEVHGDRELVVVTIAAEDYEAMAEEYRKLFQELGVERVRLLPLRSRSDANSPDVAETLHKAGAIFFTGGDQLRLTSQLGDSQVFQRMRELHERGVALAGTSAGAAAMSSTMIVSGASDESGHVKATQMSPGLGFVEGVVIDSHFAERGRIGRLLGAVAQNPANIGLGIDEDTAIIVEKGDCFEVLGSGAVYVVDGTELSYSSLSEERMQGIVTIHDVKLHVLGDGNRFDLKTRRPMVPAEATVEIAGAHGRGEKSDT